MSKHLKVYFIGVYFAFFYLSSLLLFMNIDYLEKYENGVNTIWEYSFFIFFINIIYIIIKNKLLYFSIIMKILFFTIAVTIYFIIEQSIMKLTMYGIGGNGGLIRSNIYENFEYVLNWKEVLFWNFIFSLHYPIYIFIFFKPFVNYLDKSIQKIKIKKSEKLKQIKSVIDNRSKKI